MCGGPMLIFKGSAWVWVFVNLDSEFALNFSFELQFWSATGEEQDLTIYTYALWALVVLHVGTAKCSALSAAVSAAVGISIPCAYAYLGYILSLDTGWTCKHESRRIRSIWQTMIETSAPHSASDWAPPVRKKLSLGYRVWWLQWLS